MAIKVRTSELVKELKADVRVRRLADTFANTEVFKISIDDRLDELTTAHKLRDVRRLNPTEPGFLDALVKANTQDQSTRSRVSEILMECTRGSAQLEELLSYITQYLLVTYSMELRHFKTREERMYVVHAVLRTYRKYQSSLTTLRDTAKLVLEDIDKAAWSLKLSVLALQIHSSKEQII